MWPSIIEQIEASHAEARPLFFNVCVATLRNLPQASVKKDKMTLRAELGIAIYQCNIGLEIIASRRYLHPKDTALAFAREFYAPTSRIAKLDEQKEREELMRRYWPRRKGHERMGGEILLFYSDLARYITGTDAPATETMLLSTTTIQQFTAASRLPIAAVFGDRELVNATVNAASF